MSELGGFVDAFANVKPALRRRQGYVSSVESDYTVTVTVAGGTTSVAGVRYLGHVPPTAGEQVWLDTDGVDLIAVGVVAGLGGYAHAARWQKSAAQNVTDDGVGATLLTFNTKVSDPASLFDDAQDRYTVKLPGLYLIMGGVTWKALTDKEARWSFIRVNGAVKAIVRQENIGHATHELCQVVSCVMPMAVGDYAELYANQDTNVTMTGGVLADASTFFSIAYLGPDA